MREERIGDCTGTNGARSEFLAIAWALGPLGVYAATTGWSPDGGFPRCGRAGAREQVGHEEKNLSSA